MNRILKSMAATLLLWLLICPLCGLAESRALAPAEGTVTVDGAAMRREPTKAVSYLVRLNRGDLVTVTDAFVNVEGNWAKVSCQRGKETLEGYLLLNYVSVELFDGAGEPFHLPVEMRVSATAECHNYNHVGYRWTKAFQLNGEELKGPSKCTLTAGDELALSACITETDAFADVGEDSVLKIVTQEELDNGFTVDFTVTVAENRGRYSGYECVWHVTFRFTRA